MQGASEIRITSPRRRAFSTAYQDWDVLGPCTLHSLFEAASLVFTLVIQPDVTGDVVRHSHAIVAVLAKWCAPVPQSRRILSRQRGLGVRFALGESLKTPSSSLKEKSEWPENQSAKSKGRTSQYHICRTPTYPGPGSHAPSVFRTRHGASGNRQQFLQNLQQRLGCVPGVEGFGQ